MISLFFFSLIFKCEVYSKYSCCWEGVWLSPGPERMVFVCFGKWNQQSFDFELEMKVHTVLLLKDTVFWLFFPLWFCSFRHWHVRSTCEKTSSYHLSGLMLDEVQSPTQLCSSCPSNRGETVQEDKDSKHHHREKTPEVGTSPKCWH